MSRVFKSCGRVVSLLTVMSCLGCTEEGINVQPAPVDSLTLTYPSDVAIFGKYLVVTDCAYDAATTPLPYQEGKVAIIDRETMKLVNTLPTSALNPQWVTVVGNKAYVVSSGAFDFDMEKYFSFAASDGAVDILDLNDISKWSATINLPRSTVDTRLGGFGRLAVTNDGKIGYLGSGTTNGIFELDLVNNKIVHGVDDPIWIINQEEENTNGMNSLRMFDNKLYVASFNNDSVCVSDSVSDHLEDTVCGLIGYDSQILEGPIDIALDFNNTDLVVAMSIANAVYYVEYDKSHGRFELTQTSAVGSSPNAIGKNKPYVYVVNSMNSSLTRQNVSTKEIVKSWAVFPENSSPAQLAIDKDSKKIYVTLAGTGTVAVVSMDDGSILEYAKK